MTNIVQQGSSLSSGPTPLFLNPHFKLTFSSLILCQVLSGGRQRQISSFIWVLKSNHITSESSNQMARAEIDWLYPTVHVREQVLRNIFGGTFSDSFRQNLSLHPHCQNILQLTSCQICNFLPSCWDWLLTRWLKICVSNDKFGFSQDNC